MALAPWIAPAVLAEYVHNVGIRFRRQFRGHTRHPGGASSIVRACIESCWNGRTFTASPGHFDMFWTRDLSFSVPSLVRLGHGLRVHASLAYALDVWSSRRRHITTTIHYFDRPGDVYEYGVDSLPLFLAALRAIDATDLVERHRAWLEDEIAHYYRVVVDPATGLVRSDRKFSAHRDTVVNRSNAYGNTMVALLAKTIEETGWFASPFERHFQGRLRPSADRAVLGSATTSGTPSTTTRSRARPTSGRSTRVSSAIRRWWHRPSRTSTPTASATRTRCATRPLDALSARSG